MKKHNLLKVLLIMLLIVVVGSWFLPVYDVDNGAFKIVSSGKIGLFTLMTFLKLVIDLFAPTILFVLSIGGLYGVLYRVPQYRALLDKIVKGFEGKEYLFMILVGVVFAVLSSMAGLSVVLLLLFPFVISIILLMGYDKITAIMLTVGSVISGLIGSVFSAGIVKSFSEILQELFSRGDLNFADADKLATMDAPWKLALLVLSLALVLVNTILYASKHKAKKVDLEESVLVPKAVKGKGLKVYPLVIILDVLLVVLTLAFISWNMLGVNLFNEMTNGFINPTGSAFIKGLYGGLNTVLGLTDYSANAFGNWTLYDATLVVLLTSGLIALVYRIKFNELVNSLGEGVKKALRPALLVTLAYLILVCFAKVPCAFSILRHIIDLNSGFSFIIMVIVAIVFCVFTVDIYFGVYVASSYIFTKSIITGNEGIIALIWQAVYGVMMLVAPTSIVLLATLAYTDVSYTKWIKSVWKLFLELFAMILVVLLIFNAV